MSRPITFYVVAKTFLDPATRMPLLGGTESYTAALARLSIGRGGQTFVFQRAGSFVGEKLRDGLTVYSWNSVGDLRSQLRALRSKDPGVLFLYEPTFQPKREELPCILVQHGVGSDGTADPVGRSRLTLLVADIRRRCLWLREATAWMRISSSYSRVLCVDTNFINQVRCSYPMYDWSRHLSYVPNFGCISDDQVVDDKWRGIRPGSAIVLFARRFVIHRGIYLWAECLRQLAVKYPASEFRVVGYGDGESQIRSLMRDCPNIHMYSRTQEQMQQEHEQAHIEVVPSLWSEGTSLSAIEAMGAGCAVVCSDVGGLCNLILPGFNGYLTSPNSEAFTRVVERLLEAPRLALEMGLRAHQSAKCSFSVQAWEKRVMDIVEEVTETPYLGHAPRRFKPAS